jgi:undecaprenyl diphosphate synthase
VPANNKKLPRHIAIIMDGNNRWSKQNNNSQLSGHRKGALQSRIITNYCVDLEIDYLTLFVFSSENWLRPKKEVSSLMALFLSVLQRREVSKLHERNVRINFIGDSSHFPKKLQEKMQIAKELTKNNTGLTVNVAANYGGRWDIAHATKAIAEKVKQGSLDTTEINQELMQQYIYHLAIFLSLIYASGQEEKSGFPISCCGNLLILNFILQKHSGLTSLKKSLISP